MNAINNNNGCFFVVFLSFLMPYDTFSSVKENARELDERKALQILSSCLRKLFTLRFLVFVRSFQIIVYFGDFEE